jgi:hypothetical protein
MDEKTAFGVCSLSSRNKLEYLSLKLASSHVPQTIDVTKTCANNMPNIIAVRQWTTMDNRKVDSGHVRVESDGGTS